MVRFAVNLLLGFAMLGCGADAQPRGASSSPDAGESDACASLDKSALPKDLHAAAAQVLTAASPCGLSICHDGDRPESGLGLLGVTDLRAALVDLPACQAPTLLLVDGRGGVAGLAGSWLWQKLVAPANSAGVLSEQASFGESASCAQQPGQPFGERMPKGSQGLSEPRLSAIRNWICAGAPGP